MYSGNLCTEFGHLYVLHIYIYFYDTHVTKSAGTFFSSRKKVFHNDGKYAESDTLITFECIFPPKK